MLSYFATAGPSQAYRGTRCISVGGGEAGKEGGRGKRKREGERQGESIPELCLCKGYYSSYQILELHVVLVRDLLLDSAPSRA